MPNPSTRPSGPDQHDPATLAFQTQAVHCGNQADVGTAAIRTPIVMANSRTVPEDPCTLDPDNPDLLVYTGESGANQLGLQTKLAVLEGGEDAVVLGRSAPARGWPGPGTVHGSGRLDARLGRQQLRRSALRSAATRRRHAPSASASTGSCGSSSSSAACWPRSPASSTAGPTAPSRRRRAAAGSPGPRRDRHRRSEPQRAGVPPLSEAIKTN